LTSNINQYDVAIVGFGLIGQICAKVCSRYNLRTLVIESRSDAEFTSNAISFDDESLRLLEGIGLYNAVKVFLNKPDFTDIVLTNGRVIQRNPVLNTDNGFPSICTFFQPEIEKIIREICMADKNIDLLFDNEPINFITNDNKVRLDTKSGNKLNHFEALYLLACDGINSFVRRKLDIETVDERYSKNWLLVDILLKDNNRLENVFRQICDDTRPTSYISLSNKRHRFEFQLLAGEQHQKVIKKNNIQNLISKWIQHDHYEIENVSIQNFRGSYAKTFQKDNIFLIGDSAYQMPPYASQGLNTGIRDILNLIWKINLVVHSNCNKNLLLSYSLERTEQIKQTIKSSIALGQLIDSLSMAFQKNMPLEESIAPEARDQAFGRKNSIEEKDSIKGIFSHSQNELIINRRLSNKEITNNENDGCLDKLVGNCFAIFSSKDIKNKLNDGVYEKLINLNFKFIHDYAGFSLGSELSEYLEIGEIIIRPDKKIYGLSSRTIDINQLALELLSQIE
jgi:2-polyprenyl-6-methoxyphenol hydroxylase-like FAD-dependent oxidoreductase